MGPVDAVMTCLRKYVGFSGRASRAEFWWFFLFYIVAYLVTFAIGAALNSVVLYLLAVVGLILPTLAVYFRRLHDTGHSGWWILITLIPFIGTIWLIILLASQGDAAANKYGPPPTMPAIA